MQYLHFSFPQPFITINTSSARVTHMRTTALALYIDEFIQLWFQHSGSYNSAARQSLGTQFHTRYYITY